MNASFLQRFRIQLRTELSLLRWQALAMPVVLVLRLWYRLPESTQDLHVPALQGIASTPVRALAQLLPVWMVFLSIRADAPANSDTASLARPLGGVVMWCAKLLALTLTIAVPWLCADLYVASTVPQSAASWLAIVLSSLMNSLILIALVASAACLARGQVKAMGMVLAACFVWHCWDSGLSEVTHQMLVGDRSTPTLRACASIVSQVIALSVLMTAWWFAMALRQRRAVIATLLVGVVVLLGVHRAWTFDWLQRPALQLSSQITLRVGKPDAKDSTPSQALWPTLRIAGLGKDEVAAVLAFAPLNPGQPWPGTDFKTDFPPGGYNPTMQWLTNDHVRPVMDHYASDDLWPNSESRENPSRPPLAKLIKNPNQTWRLRVAVHRMKSLGGCRMSDLIHGAVNFPVRQGATLRIGPERSLLNFYCGLQTMRSSLLPERNFAPISYLDSKVPAGTPLAFHFLLVAHDPEARENWFTRDDMAGYWSGQNSSRGLLLEDTGFRGVVCAWLPTAPIKLGFTTEERQKQATMMQVWIAEECGTQDFDLTPEQLKHALTPAVPSPPPSAR